MTHANIGIKNIIKDTTLHAIPLIGDIIAGNKIQEIHDNATDIIGAQNFAQIATNLQLKATAILNNYLLAKALFLAASIPVGIFTYPTIIPVLVIITIVSVFKTLQLANKTFKEIHTTAERQQAKATGQPTAERQPARTAGQSPQDQEMINLLTREPQEEATV